MANKKTTQLTLVESLPDTARIYAVDEARAVGDQSVQIEKSNLIPADEVAVWNEITGDQKDVNLIGFTDGQAFIQDFTTQTSPNSNSWNDVTYGNNLWVAVSPDGTGVMTSPDTIIWTARNESLSANWATVTYGNGLFVAMGSGTSGVVRCMTSPDGIAWTTRTVATTQITVNNLIWVEEDNQFVAIGRYNSVGVNGVLTSPDAITWTERASDDDGIFTGLAYGNGTYVAATTNYIMISTDNAVTWSATFTLGAWSDVIFVNGQFIVVGDNDSILIGNDGINWEVQTIPFGNTWEDIAYGNGVYIITPRTASDQTIISSNLSNWSYKPYAITGSSVREVHFANDIFVTVGDNGLIATSIALTTIEFENIVNEYQLNGVTIPIVDKVLNIEATSGGVSSIIAGTGISVDQATGDVTVTATGGGGGAATQLEQGTAYTTLGELLNDSFAGVTLNGTNWTNSSPIADYTVNNKLIVNSGASNWTDYIEATKFYLYEKQDFVVDFTPITNAVGDGWGFSQRPYPVLFADVRYFKFDQNTGVFSAGATTSADTFKLPPIEFALNDNLRLTFRRTPSGSIITVENLTDPTKPTAYGEMPYSKWGTSGNMRLSFLGGQQEFTNITIDSYVRNYAGTEGVVFMGNSITAGSEASSVAKRWTNRLMNNQQHLFENLGLSSWDSRDFTAGIVTEILGNINGKYLVINIGYNDQSRAVPTATYTTNLETIATTAQGLGYEIIFVSPFPRLSATNATYVTAMQTAATNTSSIFIDMTPTLGNIVNENLLADGIHPNDLGYETISNAIKQARPEIIESLTLDLNVEDVYLRGIPQSPESLPLVGINEKGLAVKLDPSKYINQSNVLLQKNLNSVGNPQNYQVGNLGIDGAIGNKKRIMSLNPSGLQIGFNQGTTLNTSSNIEIANGGSVGIEQQNFTNFTGTGNIKMVAGGINRAISTIGLATITGNNNTLINAISSGAISGEYNTFIGTATLKTTTGNDNIFIGKSAGQNMTTGSENLHLWTGSENPNFLNTMSNSIFLGNVQGFNEIHENGVISISSSSSLKNKFWFGGGNGTQGTEMHASSTAPSTNSSGFLWEFFGSKGRGTGTGGGYVFRVSDSGTSGSTLHSTFTDILSIDGTKIEANKPIQQKGYTVATLPSGVLGMTCYVTDASAITYRATATGGGSGNALVFFDGTNWIYH